MDTTSGGCARTSPGTTGHPSPATISSSPTTVGAPPACSPGGAESTLRSMVSVAAPDPLTFTIHWSQINVRAAEAVGLDPLPRHLLEAPFQTMSAESFGGLPYFRTEFVGLGPFPRELAVRGWGWTSPASTPTIAGPARVDRILLRFTPDPQVLVASILSAPSTSCCPGVEGFDAAATVKRQWEEPPGTRSSSAVGGPGSPTPCRCGRSTRSRSRTPESRRPRGAAPGHRPQRPERGTHQRAGADRR